MSMPLLLPAFNVDPSRISVSGLSAGAFMAHQLHVAYSDLFCGAGLVAGGAYQVSQGTLMGAMGAMAYGMRGHLSVSPEVLADAARRLSAHGHIAALDNLEASRVWVFHGSRDTTVSELTSEALVGFYQSFLPDGALKYVSDVAVVHAMPTDGFGALPDAVAQSPYLVNAGYDAAGELLRHIHGELAPRAQGSLPGEWHRFDQNVFLPNAAGHSMDNIGYAYVPSGALRGERCGVHVALHGCSQSARAVGDVFLLHAGYNAWAESNNFIVLYPQARSLVNYRVFNPRGSFDWWGLDDNNYALRSGRQMKAIADMVQALTGQRPGALRQAA
jgi:poly(3-hydroxybutyrate) depolymerase